jgi:hypothetical protein
VPEQNTKPFAVMAWLYGPSAAGAASVETAVLVIAADLSSGEPVLRRRPLITTC